MDRMSKYIDNVASLSAGLRTPSERAENMMGFLKKNKTVGVSST
jgi:hypothetical protein